MRDGNGIHWDNIRPTAAARVVADRSPYQQGRDEERAAIARWLAAWAENARSVHATDTARVLDRVADAIKAGEYLTLPENPEQG
jgi:hypothetical protein